MRDKGSRRVQRGMIVIILRKEKPEADKNLEALSNNFPIL